MDFPTKKQMTKQKKAKVEKERRERIPNDPVEEAKEKLKRHLRLVFYHLLLL